MTNLFLTLFNKSLSACLLILAVMLVRLAFRKAPKALFPILWAFVGLRLALPFLPESRLSVIPSPETLSYETVRYSAHPTVHTGIHAVNSAVNPTLGKVFETPAGGSVSPLYVLASILGAIWVIGVIVMLFYAFFCYFHLKNRLKTAVLFRDNLYQSEAVTSPFVLGFIRPRIYLPFTLAEKDLDAVVAHEKAHIARGDVLWKLLGYLFLCVYWFNPLVWLAYILFCRDIEFACDERVIGQLAAEERAAYSEALLAASMPKARIAACPLAFGEGNVKERIKRVLSYKKPAFWVILIAVLACAALAVCFLTDPVGFTVKNPAVGEYIPGAEGMQGNVDTDYFTSVSPDFAIGAGADGKAVFKNPKAAFETFRSLYENELSALRKAFGLPAFSQKTYASYKIYGWQYTGSDGKRFRFISSFLDIYENSFTRPSRDSSLSSPTVDDSARIDGISVGDVFVTDKCLYMSPLSSTWAGKNDGFRYLVGADTFTLERQDSSLGVEPIELSVSWKWENLPWTREELASQKTVWDIGATGLLDYTDLRYQRLDDGMCLLYADGDVLLMRYSTEKVFLVWSIYRLEKQ